MEKLGINVALSRVCESLNIRQPTEIQRKAVPLILKGQDVVGVAHTGSGKTLAYCLPMLQRLASDPYGVYGVVLLPTKELAVQVYEQFCVFASPLSFKEKIGLVVGGEKWISQTSALLSERLYVVVATPGRLLDHLEKPEVRRAFRNLAVFVLDEADRLLSGTLAVEVQRIFEAIHKWNGTQPQYLQFTATKSDELNAFRVYLGHRRRQGASAPQLPFPNLQEMCSVADNDSRNHMPVLIDTTVSKAVPLENLQQLYLFVPARVKAAYLVYLLNTTFKDQTGILFTKTCQTCQIIATLLELFEFQSTTLHGLLDQRRRTAHLAKFRSAHVRLLVATDVASRGLDIPKVDFVLNFDFPTTPTDYIHRVGRTARAGRQGTALSIICDKDHVDNVHAVEARTGVQLRLLDVDEDAVLKQLTAVTKKLQEARATLMEGGFFDRAVQFKENKQKRRAALFGSVRPLKRIQTQCLIYYCKSTVTSCEAPRRLELRQVNATMAPFESTLMRVRPKPCPLDIIRASKEPD